MLKNILAAIGFIVLAKKGFDYYCEHEDLKKENEFFRSHQSNHSSGGSSD